MKTVCFVINQHDANWLAEYWNNHIGKEEISVIASSFEGRITAQSLNIPYKSYEENAWAVDKAKIFDQARRQAYYWHQLPELKSNPYLEAVRTFKDYPLLVIHHPTFFQSFQEILQSYTFIKKIIQKENPDRIIVGKQENPFDNEAQPPFNSTMLNILTSSNGLEHEALKMLAISKNIEIVVKEIQTRVRNTAVADVPVPSSKEIVWDSRLTGPKILVFTWGGYYFQQISETFGCLLEGKSRIGVVIVGDKLAPDEERELKQKNIYVTYKSDWPVKNEAELLFEWKSKGEGAFESISENRELRDYFSDAFGSYFQGLAREAIKANLTKYIPYTVRELLRSENIIHTFNPDVVVAHFAWHPWESTDVLPARLSGIPTLTMEHGISASMIAPIDTFSSEYYAANGIAYKEALTKSQGCSDDSIALVGNCRFDKIKVTNSNMKEIKKAFGLNPESPVCIFCDSSGWSHAFEKRHSVFKTIEQILALKNIFPELQIVYRIHHGLSSGNFMKRIFDNTKIPGFIFQISPSPLFTDIVQAADFVIAHHTSAIAEALLSGVRVIYLTALSSIIERDHYCCDAVKIADNFEILPNIINKFLNNQVSKEDVRVMAQPYFEKLLNGCDGKSNNRLSRLILKLTEIPENQREKGFCDWIKRIEASCEFKIGQTNSIQPNKGDSKVSKSNDTTNVATEKAKTKSDYTGHNLVFIVGCPRSGTTWLQRLLACHPKIRSGQESDVFDMFIGPQLRAWRSLLNYKLSRRPVGLTSYLRETEYLSALRQYMMNLIEPMIGNLQKDEIFVEKTPSHALYIPEIIEMLPGSRIIHILRDVRDVVASLLAASKSWGNYWAPKDAKAATQMWVQHVRAVRESARNITGSQFFELYYEDLSAATENVLRDLCMFLGLEWDEKGIAAAIENNRLEIAKKTAGTVIPVGGELASLLGPITKEPEGFVRKGRPGSWKEDLYEQELLLISQVAGNTMEEVGYSWNDPEELQSCTKKRMGYYNQMRRIENNVESLVTMIKKLRDDGYLEKAAFDTEQALKKYPCSLDLHNLKAELEIQKGNIKEGKQILLELIKYFPDNIETLNNLGIVSVYEENLNSAVEFFKYVLILDSGNKVALENLSHIGEKCSISDNLHFKSSDIISKDIYKNAYPLHNFHNIPKELRQSYYDHTKDPLSNIDYYKALKDRLVSLNVIVEEREIDINDFEQWLNEFSEIKNHYQNHGDVFIEKCLEHYLTYRYLNISQDDVFIDIAASGSPWAEVLNFRGIKSYRLDMTYPGGFNGINIGADASNSGLPEGFCSALALHCAFECFMGDADIRFAKEASRILKINGRYAIAPLYLEDTYFVSTSPLCDQKNITIEKEALKVWRDDEYKVPFDRFYSPEAFKQRVYSHIPENMDTMVLYFNNLEYLNKYYKGQRIYCFFMFYGKKRVN